MTEKKALETELRTLNRDDIKRRKAQFKERTALSKRMMSERAALEATQKTEWAAVVTSHVAELQKNVERRKALEKRLRTLQGRRAE